MPFCISVLHVAEHRSLRQYMTPPVIDAQQNESANLGHELDVFVFQERRNVVGVKRVVIAEVL